MAKSCMAIDGLALVRLMRLVSPALPIGAFAYSQGLEAAIECGWVHDAATARDWFADLLEHALVPLDLPLLARLAAATARDDAATIALWNSRLLAARESAELRAEDLHLGTALWRLLTGLELAPVALRPPGDLSFACAFALAGKVWAIPTDVLLTGYAWSWLENQVGAATKLVPLGQTAAQSIIEALLPQLPTAIAAVLSISDDEIGAALPGLAWLSARHEVQYSRLFRS